MELKTTQNEVWEQIARKIRFLQHNQSITIKQMAERLGVEVNYLKEVADGLAKPTRHLLNKICAVFNLKLDYFESEVLSLLGAQEEEEKKEENLEDLKARTPPLPYTPEANKRKALPVGTPAPHLPPPAPPPKKKRRKLNIAGLAAHHQALLECLIERKLLSAQEYQKKVADVRQRAKLEKAGP
ncbi:MAG: helix-turn-helix transcriptional regulator [Planctomycetes bacterium]|nr:helix-turn-helix transcriptional regulator [Planctomycetota bacterium]